MTLDEENGEFSIVMHHCPSKGRLLEFKHLTPYPDYCEHCDLLYRRILEPMGYQYDVGHVPSVIRRSARSSSQRNQKRVKNSANVHFKTRGTVSSVLQFFQYIIFCKTQETVPH